MTFVLCVCGYKILASYFMAMAESQGPLFFNDRQVDDVKRWHWLRIRLGRSSLSLDASDLLLVLPVYVVAGRVQQLMREAHGPISRVHNIVFGFVLVEVRCLLFLSCGVLTFVGVRELLGANGDDAEAWSALVTQRGSLPYAFPSCAMAGGAIITAAHIYLLSPSTKDIELNFRTLPVPTGTVQVLIHGMFAVGKYSLGKSHEMALQRQHYETEPDAAWKNTHFLEHVSVTPQMDVHCTILLWNPPGAVPALIVCHRGTLSVESLRVDLKANRTVHGSFSQCYRNYFGDRHVEVHRGFMMALRALEEKHLTSKILGYAQDWGVDSVWFAGHSLGGALAALNALEFAIRPECEQFTVGVVTLAQPHVGNVAFAKLFEKFVPVRLRIVLDKDPIPSANKYVGCKYVRCPYKHFAPMAQVTTTGQFVVDPTLLERTLVFRSTRLSAEAGINYLFLGFRLMRYHQLRAYCRALSRMEQIEATWLRKNPRRYTTRATRMLDGGRHDNGNGVFQRSRKESLANSIEDLELREL